MLIRNILLWIHGDNNRQVLTHDHALLTEPAVMDLSLEHGEEVRSRPRCISRH